MAAANRITIDNIVCRSEEVEEEILIVEEDWSKFNKFEYYGTNSFPLFILENPDYRTGGADDIIAQHQPHCLQMNLRCVDSLTPLDMMDLSNGTADATGNRIWMGALFFIECFVRPLPLLHADADDAAGINSNDETVSSHFKISALLEMRKALFLDKNVCELGAGTGASLIAVGLAGTHDEHYMPSLLTLTDNDPRVLELCDHNCIINLEDLVRFQVLPLDWGKDDHNLEQQTLLDREELRASSQNTVVATDVIYDLSALKPLMETAYFLLMNGGFFVLSHVPRASIDCELKDIGNAIEQRILDEAAKVDFTVITKHACSKSEGMTDIAVLIGKNDYAIRPNALMDVWGGEAKMMSSDDCDFLELDSMGASIIIFRKE
jgi:hypothetical protein